MLKLRNKPEPARRKIFFGAMVSCVVVVFSAYVFSVTRSVTVVIDKEKRASEGGLLGEFSLPSLKDSVSANVKDIIKSVKGR